jgi:hypothetical protein
MSAMADRKRERFWVQLLELIAKGEVVPIAERLPVLTMKVSTERRGKVSDSTKLQHPDS